MKAVYVYRLTSDTGLAPCVKNGLLTLACCKGGQIRGEKVISTGLRYRIGTKRKQDGVDYSADDVYILGIFQDKMLYIAKVDNVITMEEYYNGTSKGRTDDIYSINNGKLERNKWLQKEEVHTEPGRIMRDLAGKYVLLSKDFVYLGKDAVDVRLLKKYIPRYQETKFYKNKDAEIIISECLKCDDGKSHMPTTPFRKSGGCR